MQQAPTQQFSSNKPTFTSFHSLSRFFSANKQTANFYSNSKIGFTFKSLITPSLVEGSVSSLNPTSFNFSSSFFSSPILKRNACWFLNFQDSVFQTKLNYWPLSLSHVERVIGFVVLFCVRKAFFYFWGVLILCLFFEQEGEMNSKCQ